MVSNRIHKILRLRVVLVYTVLCASYSSAQRRQPVVLDATVGCCSTTAAAQRCNIVTCYNTTTVHSLGTSRDSNRVKDTSTAYTGYRNREQLSMDVRSCLCLFSHFYSSILYVYFHAFTAVMRAHFTRCSRSLRCSSGVGAFRGF